MTEVPKRSIQAIAAALLVSAAASGQTAPATPASPSGDSVVTLSQFDVSAKGDKGYNTVNTVGATMLNTPIIDTSMSIVVLNKEFIDDIASNDPTQTATWISGVAQASTSAGEGQITIRGEDITPGIRDGVLDLQDATGGVYWDSALVERIEIIKGPEGTLYGDYSGQGGLMNVITKAPEPVAKNELSFSVGADEFGGTVYRGVADVTGPAPNNPNFEYRIVADGQRGKTLADLVDDEFMVSPMFSYRFAGGGTVLFRWIYQNPDRALGGSWFADATNHFSTFLSPYVTDSENDLHEDQLINTVDLQATQPFNTGPIHWEARLYLRYNHFEDQRIYYNPPSTGISFENAQGQVIGTQSTLSFSDPAIAEDVLLTRLYENGQEFCEGLNSNFDMAGKVDIGPTKNTVLFYTNNLEEFLNNRLYSDASYPGIVLWQADNPGYLPYHFQDPAAYVANETVATNQDIATDLWSVGAQENTSFWNDRVNVVAAIRNDHQNQTTYNYVSHQAINGDIRTGTTHKYGVVFNAWGPIYLFYNYSQTFAPNGFGTDINGNSIKLPNLNSTINEEGLKFDFFNDRLVLTASGFKTVVANELVQEVVYNAAGTLRTTLSVPAGQGIIQGWEADGTWVVTDDLNLLFGGGSLTSKTQTGLSARNVPVGFDYRAFAKYTFHRGALKGAYLGFGVLHDGPRAVDAADDLTYPPFTNCTGLVGYHYHRWRLQIDVYNVFNSLYPANGIGRNLESPSTPRDAEYTVTYAF